MISFLIYLGIGMLISFAFAMSGKKWISLVVAIFSLIGGILL